MQVFFADGSKTERVAVDYPIGHRRRREEGIPQLVEKFERSLATRFDATQRARDRGRVRGSSRARGAAGGGVHGAVGAEAVSSGQEIPPAVAKHAPLQIPGAINAYCALLVEQAGFKALYLSGAGVANASFGLPDLGVTALADVLEDARRITAATELPLLVDVDTGLGSAFNIARTVREMERAGVAAMHIEDQEQAKRCGHRPNKATVAAEEMCDRLKAAVDARRDERVRHHGAHGCVRARGQQASLDRVAAYVEAGADMIFAEALYTLDDYARSRARSTCPCSRTSRSSV